MRNTTETVQVKPGSSDDAIQSRTQANELPLWVSPRLEDVSEQVMAQPYIRFT
ncbi:MAG: hypothetical protein PHT60_04950 [Acidiphilium sp.]|nr:hypothetical protein [Acidiphilium sp.]MDD4935111.1 hypothetical protein [Acidiphilium sp.]